MQNPNHLIFSLLRPQSAFDRRHDSEPVKEAASRTPRPQTAVIRQRGELTPKRVIRQRLRKPHLKAVGRDLDAGGIASQQLRHSETFRNANFPPCSSGMGMEVETMVRGGKILRTSISATAKSPVAKHGDGKDEARRDQARKQPPCLETWSAGSAHDSEEYDTDLDTKDTAVEKDMSQHVVNEASGVVIYEEECRRHGSVPVSYMCRHLGKRNIRMRHHYLGGKAVQLLAAAFKHNTITECLDLSDNYLEAGGAVALANMMRENTFIVTLNLSNNFIGSAGSKALADMLDSNTTLKNLSMAGNQMVDKDALWFIEPLKNNLSLSCLDLSHNEFSEIGGLHLGAVVTVNDGISDLDLSWNSIRKRGAVALVNGLKVNTTLEVLDLAWNGLGREGALGLQKALQVNASLKVLDISNNRLDAECGVKLAAGLRKNRGLETLILNLNPLGDEGIEAVLKSVTAHPSMKLLSLEEMGMNETNLQRIQELEQDKGMIVLHGGSGGYQRNSSLTSLLQLFGRFLREHRVDFDAAFRQQDKDRSGILTAEETKQCLRTAGFRLTSRQLDLLIDEIDFLHSGNIRYQDVLSGKVFAEFRKRRPSHGFTLSAEFKDSIEIQTSLL